MKIKIINCTAYGDQFKNITKDSIHEVIKPPKEYDNKKNKNRGWWVMGIGEPVLILFNEAVVIERD